MTYLRLLPVIILAALAGCANPPPISTAPVATAAETVAQDLGLKPTIETDLTDAQFNLSEAVRIGVLKPDDPALACLNGVVATLNPANAQSFTPKIAGVASGGAVLYIQLEQARAAQAGGLASLVPTGCKTVVGDLVLKGLSAANKTGLAVVTGGLVR